MNREELLGDIPFDVAKAAHALTSFVPEKRAAQRQADYADGLLACRELMEGWARDAGTMDKLEDEFSRFRAGYRKRYLAWLHASARVASPMITGPANFPVDRNRKAGDTADRRRQDLCDYERRAMRAISRILNPATRPIMSGDDDAADRLRAQLAEAEARQMLMKAANTALRKNLKNGYDAQRAAIIACGVSEAEADDLLQLGRFGGNGFRHFEITNNGANIRRIKQRLALVEKNKGLSMSVVNAPNARIEDDPPANRIRLFFPGKPDPDTRARLKSGGFRWSPTIGAWQAYRNWRSLDTAKQVAGIA